MAKPNFKELAGAAAWGDLAGTTEPMLSNLYAVSIKLPPALKALFPAGGPVLSMLASKVEFPEEALETAEIKTKLSTYDVVVGKKKGDLGITFREQIGAPVSALLDAWHRLACDARNGGIGFPDDYKTEIWVAALTGDGAPFYWWGFKLAFPLERGKPGFETATGSPVEISATFKYVEMVDVVDSASTAGSGALSGLASVASKLGI